MNHYFIGLMLASGSTAESGVAVLDQNNEIILLDKLFTMQDVEHFFENFSSLKKLSYLHFASVGQLNAQRQMAGFIKTISTARLEQKIPKHK